MRPNDFKRPKDTTRTKFNNYLFQEAIENTIGAVKVVKKVGKRRSKSARPVLGQLNSDKIYLENLLKNPDLAIADKKNDIVMRQAEEAIRFLENREEFWRQQQTQ